MALTVLQAVSWVIHPRNPKTHKLLGAKDLKPIVFLDISVDGVEEGRIVLELAGDRLPRTCENFRALCTGEMTGKVGHGHSMHLKGSRFHSVRPEDAIVGGDFVNGNGTGGFSIYGPTFPNDRRLMDFSLPGTISMVATGPGLNESSSIFFITPNADPEAYPKQIAFGHVIEGLSILRKLVTMGDHSGRPTADILIENCGQLGSRADI